MLSFVKWLNEADERLGKVRRAEHERRRQEAARRMKQSPAQKVAAAHATIKVYRVLAPYTGPSWVYFVQCGDDGPVKIGVARNVARRVYGLQTACPFEIIVRGTISGDAAVEHELHARIEHARIRGEWFEATAALTLLEEMKSSAVLDSECESSARRQHLVAT